MEDLIQRIKDESLAALEKISQHEELEKFRVAFLGKKGKLTAALREMGKLPADMRPAAGKTVNELRDLLENRVAELKDSIKHLELQRAMQRDAIDVTLPGKLPKIGGLHPMTRVTDDFIRLFVSMGFTVAHGPEIETDYYNFEALNTPKNHPARDVQDTFYIEENVVLRTHTSPMQVRYMEKHAPPIKIIVPGRVYRDDKVDATHGAVFHQIEGLVLDKGITFADLKGTLEIFAKRMFGQDTKARFRPHHFPFTEPSAEMDISCPSCNGGASDSDGCRVCKGEGYIELLGCGMVHPRVLQYCGIDPDVYTGYAFGIGLERVAMRKYGIDDLRLLFENDIRFLRQF